MSKIGDLATIVSFLVMLLLKLLIETDNPSAVRGTL